MRAARATTRASISRSCWRSRRIWRSTGRLPCNVIVLLEGEEEIGSPRIAEFVRDNADRLRADLVVTADGPLHPSGRAVVNLGVRGVVHFDLLARTGRTDAHSGNHGGVMPNAIWTLVHLLATMKAPDGRITIDGLHDRSCRPDAERAAAAALPVDLPGYMAEMGLDRLDAPADRGFHDRLMFHPTLTINGLHGGYGGPGSKTVLPCAAVAKCDIRLVPEMTPDQVLDCVRAHVARHAPEVEVIGRMAACCPRARRSSRPSPRRSSTRSAPRGARRPIWYPSMGGSLPDYVFTKILGLPAFVTPYANADEANHAPNENIEVDLFHAGIRTGAALLSRLGEMKTG
jgi:acetylornithine deacetylase/succinyl-diaminopimelate desuccinylase-like protein